MGKDSLVVYIACFITKTFAMKSRRCRKTIKSRDLDPIFREGRPQFYVSLLERYYIPFGEV